MWQLSAQVLSWLMFQLKGNHWFFSYFWVRKIQQSPLRWNLTQHLGRYFSITSSMLYSPVHYFFCIIPWSAVKDFWVARMGQNFDDYPGFQPMRSWANNYAQDCKTDLILHRQKFSTVQTIIYYISTLILHLAECDYSY